MAFFSHGIALLLTLLLSLISWAHASDQGVKATGNTVRFNLTLTWEDWAPAGTTRKTILTNGQFPGPLLEVDQGDDVEVMVVNQLPQGTTMHFHGIPQINTPWSDGTPGLSQKLIPSGGQFLYKWRATEYGSYWYHAHSRGQLEDGFYGPIYIRPNRSVTRPFGRITTDKKSLLAMHKAEDTTTPIILSDWRQLTSEELWDAEQVSGLDAMCANALLINGKGSISCLGRNNLMSLLSDARKEVLGGNITDIGCIPPVNTGAQGDYQHNMSALPQSVFSGCTPSDGPTETILVKPYSRYASYDLISAAGVSSVIFAIDEHPMYVYAVDGRYVEPVFTDAIAVPNGARYSVLVELDKPAGDYTVRLANHGLTQIINTTAIMSYDTTHTTQTNSSTPSINVGGGVISENYMLADETAWVPFQVEIPSQEVSQTHVLTIDHYGTSYRWTMGNSSYPLSLEEESPVLFDPSYAEHDLSIQTNNGTWVDLIFHMVSTLQPPHPIHKHSNKFFVIGHGDGEWNYTSVAEAAELIPESFNFETPQIRDTFITPGAATGNSWLAIRYQVINPGAFLLHCHIQVHYSGGMALAVLDGVDAWPEVPEEYRDSSGFKSEQTQA
ncbi:multicopper oxidase [Aspergillus affinis]|uniref:multicopper oxidase n=1 Tax=Aspergillus affinis TaxID=1070780 RepID=UPI0022FDF4B1|nr:uncharacterized protein KD926_006085 [Aspergillus affinis]KAI9042166.1 hypothetical protein KD926_006085 [Aspergillus affinis]